MNVSPTAINDSPVWLIAGAAGSTMAPAMSRTSPNTNTPSAAIRVRAAIGSPHLRGGRAHPASRPARGRARAEDQPQVGTPDRMRYQVREERLDSVPIEARQEHTDRGAVRRENRSDQEGHPQRRADDPQRPTPDESFDVVRGRGHGGQRFDDPPHHRRDDEGEDQTEENPVDVMEHASHHEGNVGVRETKRQADVNVSVQTREVELREPRTIEPQAEDRGDMRGHEARDNSALPRGLSYEILDSRRIFPLHTRPSPRHRDVAI